jgi:hypothetical protein
MKLKLVLGTCVVVAAVAGASLFAQEKGKPAPAPAPTKDQAAMEAAMKSYATPGPAHQVLQQKAGKWNLAVKMFMPGMPAAMESKGTSDMKVIMDGRYLQDTTEGSFMNEPFHGQGLTGYDNLKKKYVGTWIDNMGTGIMTSEGTYDAATKTFTYANEMPDSTMTKYIKGRTTETWTDNDHYSMKEYSPGPDGKEYMNMQIDYTRAK